MALTPTQLALCLRATGAFIAKRRPPPHLRDLLDIRADINGSTLTIVSIRPKYNKPSCKMDEPIARVRWIGTKKKWKLYWMRADLKWHGYIASRRIRSIADALDEVHRDPYNCFFG